MRRFGSHPTGPSLSAWYDGELVDPRIAAHVDGCERCWLSVRSFARVDDAVRGRPLVALTTPPEPRRRRGIAVRAGVLVAALVAVALVGATAADHGAPSDAARTASPAPGRREVGGSSLRSSGVSSERAPTTSVPVGSSAPVPDTAVAAAGRSLVIGVPFPGGDNEASVEAAEVWRSAKLAVQAANASGGVSGIAVELRALDAGRPAAAHADVVVGGWAADPVDSPTLLRTPGPTGLLVAADPGPRDAGALLAMSVVGQNERVGVVLGPGTQRAFSDGVAAVRRTVSVEAGATSSCEAEISKLVVQGVTAVALAAPPDLVQRCISVIDERGWRPPSGVLVPSAAMAMVSPSDPTLLVLGALGLPWPSANEAGAARFRQTTGGSSYRALVTFAAVELAVSAARAGDGSVAAGWRASSTWRSDLVAYDGERNVGVRVVRASDGGWAQRWSPPPRQDGPPSSE